MKRSGHAGAITKLTALAQETRLALFRLLVEAGPAGMTAGGIAEQLGVAAPTLSFHLKELTRARLIRREQQGRYVVYRADYDAMNGLVAYLTENCCRMSCDAGCATPGTSESRRPRVAKRGAAISKRRVA